MAAREACFVVVVPSGSCFRQLQQRRLRLVAVVAATAPERPFAVAGWRLAVATAVIVAAAIIVATTVEDRRSFGWLLRQ